MSDFVSEALTPVYRQDAGHPVIAGEPVLPGQFRWRQQILTVEQILSTWKEEGPCRHGSGERYLRKHWYRIQIQDGREMEVYFERQARSSTQRKQRWWLYTITESDRQED